MPPVRVVAAGRQSTHGRDKAVDIRARPDVEQDMQVPVERPNGKLGCGLDLIGYRRRPAGGNVNEQRRGAVQIASAGK
jgi:hypothetical protein